MHPLERETIRRLQGMGVNLSPFTAGPSEEEDEGDDEDVGEGG